MLCDETGEVAPWELLLVALVEMRLLESRAGTATTAAALAVESLWAASEADSLPLALIADSRSSDQQRRG